MKIMSRQSVGEPVEPLFAYILKKRDAVDAVVKDAEKHKELIAKLPKAKSTKEERDLMEQMAVLEKDDKHLAFVSKMNQAEWIILVLVS